MLLVDHELYLNCHPTGFPFDHFLADEFGKNRIALSEVGTDLQMSDAEIYLQERQIYLCQVGQLVAVHVYLFPVLRGVLN
jgi:hypothetical protein